MADFRLDGLWVQSLGVDLATVDEATPQIPGQVGKVVAQTVSGAPRFYQYVKRSQTDAGTPAAGAVAYWADISNFTVVAATTGALGCNTNPIIAGVFLGAVPAKSQYGFIQVGGLAAVKVTDTAAVGDKLIHSAEGVLKVSLTQTTGINIPTYAIAAVAFTTATGTTRSVILNLPRINW